jgi:predicted Zn-dependent protease
VVTWSFATSPGPQTAPFSGDIQAEYQTAVEEAFETWAKAAGITLEEVPDSSTVDIRVGWGDFDTAASGLVGYTTFSSNSGVTAPGVIVRLEDPSNDPLIAGSGGSLTYAGTEAQLYQVALHEIGHSLGLAESSDPDSIMYPELGPQNMTLDASDVLNIQEIYQPGSDAGQGTLNLMIQAMASFGAGQPASYSEAAVSTMAASQALLARAMH